MSSFLSRSHGLVLETFMRSIHEIILIKEWDNVMKRYGIKPYAVQLLDKNVLINY